MSQTTPNVNNLEMPAGIVFPMMKVAAMLGLSVERIMQDFAIDLDKIMQADIISVQQFEILMEGLIALSPNKDFHVHFAQEFTFGHIEGLETLIVSGSTGEQTVNEVFSYKELFMPLFDVQIEHAKDNDFIIYASNTALPISNKYYYAEMVFVLILVFGYRLLDQPEMVDKIAFRHSKTSYHEDMEKLFKCSISYNYEKDKAWVKKPVLKSVFKSNQKLLHDSAQEILEKRLKSMRESKGLVSQVENLIYQHLNDSELNIDKISSELSMSARKLQRLLAEEDVSFSSLKERVRILTARALLTKTTRSLAEISESLGFNDVSSFSRFFSKVESCSPSQYRKS